MSDTLSTELRKNYETDENEAATLPEGVSRTEEADIITLDSDATTPRYGMPCGHAIGIESLKTYCTSELQKGKTKIQCPACTEEWQCGLIKAVVNLSVNKDKEFDTLFIQGIKDNGRDVQACPKCRTDCVRETTVDSRVRCYTCTSDRVIFEFCWYCRGYWRIPENSDCGNEGCSGEDQRLIILRTCPNKVIDYNKVTSPSIRACPSCSILLEHIGGCNNMCCSKCNHGFCFICLKQKDSRGNLPCGSQSIVCQPAPVQDHLFK